MYLTINWELPSSKVDHGSLLRCWRMDKHGWVCFCLDTDGRLTLEIFQTWVKLAGNWKGIWRWEVNQILLQLALVMLYESNNQPECEYIWFVETLGTRCQMGRAAWLVYVETLAGATNWKTQLVLCDFRHLARAANWEAQLDLWWSNGTFFLREWAIHDNPPNRQIIKNSTRGDV